MGLNIVTSEVPYEIRQLQLNMQTDFLKVFDMLGRFESKVDQGFARLAALETSIVNLGGNKDMSAIRKDGDSGTRKGAPNPPAFSAPIKKWINEADKQGTAPKTRVLTAV